MFQVFTLQLKVSWSKNVREERGCLDQILLGSNDADFCILLALSCYLESRLSTSEQGKYLFGTSDDEREPDRVNSWYSRNLREMWRIPDFSRVSSQTEGSLGSHSLHKFSVTYLPRMALQWLRLRIVVGGGKEPDV